MIEINRVKEKILQEYEIYTDKPVCYYTNLRFLFNENLITLFFIDYHFNVRGYGPTSKLNNITKTKYFENLCKNDLPD